MEAYILDFEILLYEVSQLLDYFWIKYVLLNLTLLLFFVVKEAQSRRIDYITGRSNLSQVRLRTYLREKAKLLMELLP